ncbi:hypothetical protein ACFO3O_22065 [Dokdonia ponticola]|uniref:Peptidoglycan-binding protein n=1 Tax=Dokdonia ponticola TaxID=2041041 RepID=A0ABV9I4F3_9FLAO
MKITNKEIRLSGLLIMGSGLLIGYLSSLCENKSETPKQDPEKSSPQKKTTPVVQLSVVAKDTPIEKPIQTTKTVDAPLETTENKQETISKVAEAEINEVALEGEAEPQTEIEAEQESQTEIEVATAIDDVIVLDASEQITTALEMIPDDFPLRLGSKGERVFALQKYLLKNHGYDGMVKDEYDQKLADRVLRLLKVEQVDQKLFNKLIYKRKRGR